MLYEVITLRYYPVERNGEPSGDILVELEDVTEAKRLESDVITSYSIHYTKLYESNT